MLIGIYNLEPQYENLALEKVIMHHRCKGDEVRYYMPMDEANGRVYDIIYCSSIFTFTPKDHLLIDERWVIGGTGFDVTVKLPPEIEMMKPKMNFGFTQRGCIRNCKFCVVPLKEGKSKPCGDIYDVWDGRSKDLILYDNNILSLPDHFYDIVDKIKYENLRVDWNQGLDIRLLNDEMAQTLKGLRHVEYRFAFDSIHMKDLVVEKIRLLKDNGINRVVFLTLVGFDTTIDQDFERLELLKSLGQKACVMRYQKVTPEMPDSLINKYNFHEYSQMARWSNQHNMFSKMTFKEFDKLK